MSLLLYDFLANSVGSGIHNECQALHGYDFSGHIFRHQPRFIRLCSAFAGIL